MKRVYHEREREREREREQPSCSNALDSSSRCFFPVVSAFSARRLCVGVLFGVCSLLLCSPSPAHAENERYKAFPMSPGGYVFILDTKEGHIWTWNTAGPKCRFKSIYINQQIIHP